MEAHFVDAVVEKARPLLEHGWIVVREVHHTLAVDGKTRQVAMAIGLSTEIRAKFERNFVRTVIIINNKFGRAELHPNEAFMMQEVLRVGGLRERKHAEYLNYKDKNIKLTYCVLSRQRTFLNLLWTYTPYLIIIPYLVIMINLKAFGANRLFSRCLQPFSVRVRYAPSPTGFMHVGGLRTALFNYLFARKNKGQFIVRIEDTDQNREVAGSLQNIFETLEWIGAVPDESIKKEGEFGPYIQSERLPIYKAIEKQLLKSSMAYPCFCKHDHKKEPQQTQIHKYDGKCRSLSFEEIKSRILAKQQYAVRIKSDLVPLPKTFRDEVFGDLEFKELDDFVIVRSNGWPTFHFANVIDDWKMGITHVMRGEEWLTNTNKHIYLYRLLGANVPKFVHLPLIKAMNGKKLAKRDPSSAVTFFQTGQYEVEAIKCFLAQMGLNRVTQSAQEEKEEKEEAGAVKPPPKASGKEGKQKPPPSKKQKKQQENLKLLTDSEMIEQFDISRITKVPVKFDIKQLDFLNRLSLKKRWKVAQSIDSEMQYFISKTHELIPASTSFPREYIVRFLTGVVDRFSYVTDLSLYRYYFQQPNYFDEEALKDFQKIFGKEAQLSKLPGERFELKTQNYDPVLYEKNKKIVHHLRLLFEHIIAPQLYNELEIVKKISDFLSQSPELKNEEVYHMLRFIVSGRKSGPNIALACETIGREKILGRLSAFSTL